MLAECSSQNYLFTGHQNIAPTTAGLHQMALTWEKGLFGGVWRGESGLLYLIKYLRECLVGAHLTVWVPAVVCRDHGLDSLFNLKGSG